jgi:hypothetical protein
LQQCERGARNFDALALGDSALRRQLLAVVAHAVALGGRKMLGKVPIEKHATTGRQVRRVEGHLRDQ